MPLPKPLSGTEEWNEVAHDIMAELMDAGTRCRIISMGGGDSRIRIAEVAVAW